MKRLIAAAAFAAQKHSGQRRKDQAASPYINHPLALADLLANEVEEGVSEEVIIAALLHDTLEDTDTSAEEIRSAFGPVVLAMVLEVTDDKRLPKQERKRLQIEHARHLSGGAKLVKLADKICNLRDMAVSPPAGWSTERQCEYFDWANAVVTEIRGTHAGLELLFDAAYAARPSPASA